MCRQFGLCIDGQRDDIAFGGRDVDMRLVVFLAQVLATRAAGSSAARTMVTGWCSISSRLARAIAAEALVGWGAVPSADAAPTLNAISPSSRKSCGVTIALAN